MNSLLTCRPTLQVNSDPLTHRPSTVSACGLSPDLVRFFASCFQPGDLLKSIFRVTIAQGSLQGDSLPDVSGRYVLFEHEVQFVPHFPFEKDVKYRATFDPRPLGTPLTTDPLNLEFLIPSVQNDSALTEVRHIFPSCDLLPENLLRFYVCFSNPMQRGRALKEISLLDSEGQPVDDALYRAPVELWDRTMRHLTVLLDPGRLKRWVGPNVKLGPPLKVGQEYTLEIRSGMIDLYGRALPKTFHKRFIAGDAVRKPVSVEHWKILPAVTGSRQALVLIFPSPLDWALLLRTITIESANGSVIDGQVVVDQCERRWSFTPNSAWVAGAYRIRVAPSLEDVCGNDITAAFDRSIRKGPDPLQGITGCS